VKCFASATEAKYCLSRDDINKIDIGDILLCEILGLNTYHESFDLKFIEKIQAQQFVDCDMNI